MTSNGAILSIRLLRGSVIDDVICSSSRFRCERTFSPIPNAVEHKSHSGLSWAHIEPVSPFIGPFRAFPTTATWKEKIGQNVECVVVDFPIGRLLVQSVAYYQAIRVAIVPRPDQAADHCRVSSYTYGYPG